jgi:hypothetical protein
MVYKKSNYVDLTITTCFERFFINGDGRDDDDAKKTKQR